MTAPDTLLAILAESKSGQELVTALVEREDAALDHLRFRAAELGLSPSIVAVVLCETGLGTPISEEQRQLLIAQALAEQQALAAQWRQMTGQEPPDPEPEGGDTG